MWNPMQQQQPISRNPYLETLQRSQAMQYPKYEIIHVNGRNGAEAFRMAPNSSAILMDDTQPVVWLCVSDGAGYSNPVPYKIEPFVEQPEPSYTDLMNKINELEAAIYDRKPDVKNVKPAKNDSSSGKHD